MGLEGEQTTSTLPTQTLAPKDIPRDGQGYIQTISQKGHRESPVQQVHEQTFLSAKEGFGGDEDNLRPIPPERSHQDHFLQNANLETGETPATTRSLDSILGSKGWVLAPGSVQNLSSIPGFQVQGPKLEVQSHALWLEHCTSSVHQTDQVHRE